MIRKFEPVPALEMHKGRPNETGNTICQELRDIFHLTKDPEIRLSLRIATAMAKEMDRLLTEFKQDWDEVFWNNG